MLKSLFEYVVGLSKANMVTIDGVVYTDKPLHLPETVSYTHLLRFALKSSAIRTTSDFLSAVNLS